MAPNGLLRFGWSSSSSFASERPFEWTIEQNDLESVVASSMMVRCFTTKTNFFRMSRTSALDTLDVEMFVIARKNDTENTLLVCHQFKKPFNYPRKSPHQNHLKMLLLKLLKKSSKLELMQSFKLMQSLKMEQMQSHLELIYTTRDTCPSKSTRLQSQKRDFLNLFVLSM